MVDVLVVDIVMLGSTFVKVERLRDSVEWRTRSLIKGTNR